MIATAQMRGGNLAPNITGTVQFRDIRGGVEVSVEVRGLPRFKPGTANSPQIGPHGFHIHEGGSCNVGNPNNPFVSDMYF